MAWTTPTTASGQVLTSAIWNASVRDNLQYLYNYGTDRGRAEVAHNTTQSIANSTPTALVFNTENADAFAMHSASSSRLTIPSGYGGWWLVTAYFGFASNATGYRQGSILVNGATNAAIDTRPAVNGTDTYIPLSTLVRLVATDYIEVFVVQSSGGALNVVSGPVFRAVWIAGA